MNAPAKLALRLRSICLIALSSPAASAPRVVSKILERGFIKQTSGEGAAGFARNSCATKSEGDDDLAENLSRFEPLQAALKVGKRNFHVDHWQESASHLGEALANVAHRRAERADDSILLKKKLEQVEGRRLARSRSACDQAAAALEAKQRAVECIGTDVFEGDVHALLACQLAHNAFKSLGPVIDHVVGAKR